MGAEIDKLAEKLCTSLDVKVVSQMQAQTKLKQIMRAADANPL